MAHEPAESVPVHRRSVEYEAFVRGDTLEVVGTLQDTRPWAEGSRSTVVVHDMDLRVTVRLADLTIVSASAEMRTYPHLECTDIAPVFGDLVGLSVARGYTREVQRRFGGPRGCTHLEQLARALGPVVVQAVTSRRAHAVATGAASDLLAAGASPWARNSCHVWAEGGPAEQKVNAGWRPGVGPYPAPAASTFVASETDP